MSSPRYETLIAKQILDLIIHLIELLLDFNLPDKNQAFRFMKSICENLDRDPRLHLVSFTTTDIMDESVKMGTLVYKTLIITKSFNKLLTQRGYKNIDYIGIVKELDDRAK
jgi:hypothetical protein